MKPRTSREAGRRAVVVTGTPGTGKTTISKSLARHLRAEYLSLTKLVTDEKLHEAVDQQRRTKVVDLDRTRKWLRKSISERETVTVIDTHVADVVPPEYVVKAIVLRCHPAILEARLRQKGWSPSKVRENVLAEILDSCYMIASGYYGLKKAVQVDTSRNSISNTAKECVAHLKKQLPSESMVDWIAVLDQEQVLARYIP